MQNAKTWSTGASTQAYTSIALQQEILSVLFACNRTLCDFILLE